MIDIQDISVIEKINENVPVQMAIVSYNRNNLLSYTKTVKVVQSAKPNIVPPKTNTISPVVKYCIQTLNNGSITEQKQTMSMIAKYLDNPKSVPQFLDASVLDALFAVVDQDISKYKGPSFSQKRLRKKLANGVKLSKKDFDKACSLSDKEKAIKNKVYALALIAKLQNVLYTEITKRSDLKPSFYDMPAVSGLINLYKTTTDKDVKISAMGAIYLMYRPEFYNDIHDLYISFAQSDDADIKSIAQKVLAELEQKQSK